MAVDMFLKIEGIDGVSAGEWIEIQSFSWGVTNSGSASAPGQGGGAGRPVFQDLSVTKRVDKSSPLLYLSCASGQRLSRATLTVARCAPSPDGAPSSSSMEYTLSDCLISAAKPSSSSSGVESPPLEELSFNFAKIEWTYKSNDGRAPVRTGWDLKKNTKV